MSEAAVSSIKEEESSASPADEATLDPLAYFSPSPVVRPGDHVLLVFADGRHTFATADTKSNGGYVKINKRTYTTDNLIGLPYGSLLEVERHVLKVLSPTESIVPPVDQELLNAGTTEKLSNDDSDTNNNPPAQSSKDTSPSNEAEVAVKRDNRNLVDNNQSQQLELQTLLAMRETTAGSDIVQSLIENSATFQGKTDFSKAKYIAKKQLKYQPRCRLVRCTADTLCQAVYLRRDPRKWSTIRPDTLGQILSYANLTAGAHVLVWEDLNGLITGAVAERMGGYGKVFSLYEGQQPACNEMLNKFNFPFGITKSIKWVHVGDLLNPDDAETDDVEAKDRDAVQWPCHLQEHTRNFLESEVTKPAKQWQFMTKRYNRFIRKLTRPSPIECTKMLTSRPVDGLILVVRPYDVTALMTELIPFLAPSCPFVIFCEYLEPLTKCFKYLQSEQMAINLRLINTWMREYQILPARTHPNMNMTQNGGFLLTGIKIDPVHGRNDIDEATLEAIRQRMPTRRGKKRSENGERTAGTKRTKTK